MVLFIALTIALFTFLTSATIILFVVGPTLLLQPKRRSAEFYLKLGLPTLPSDVNLNCEDITINVDGNIKLDGWLIKAAAPVKGTIIYLHGVADCKIDGIRFAKLMHDNHYNVFLYDSRRHGKSEGTYCTYGFYEKYDVSCVIDYLAARKDIELGKIGLFGTSMGAAIAIQAASIDKRITAIASENSFATLRTIFDDYQKRMIKLPFHYLRNLVIVHAELRAKFKAREVSPLEAIQTTHIPILIVCGTDDHLIKHQYSFMLFEKANQPKKIFPILGAAHNNMWDIAGKEYGLKLLEFFGTYLT
jgi:fermentation-respiration switch protein FrsA (DUF1100 family)